MSLSTNSKAKINRPGFWTANRVILTLTVVVAISALGLSSCNSTDDSSKNGAGVASFNKPVNPNSSAPNASTAPAEFCDLQRRSHPQTFSGLQSVLDAEAYAPGG